MTELGVKYIMPERLSLECRPIRNDEEQIYEDGEGPEDAEYVMKSPIETEVKQNGGVSPSPLNNLIARTKTRASSPNRRGADVRPDSANDSIEDGISQTSTAVTDRALDFDQDGKTIDVQPEFETDERIQKLIVEQEKSRLSMERLHKKQLSEMMKNMEQIKKEHRKSQMELQKARQDHELERAYFNRERENSSALERRISKSLRDTEQKLAALTCERSSESQANAPDASLALFGVYFFWVGSKRARSHAPPGFPSEKQIPNSRTRYVALGDQGSYYIHYHTIEGRCCTLLSKNFSDIYPGAHKYIMDNKQFGCPTCVSLGPSGHGFIRTESGVWHNLRRSMTSKVGPMAEVEQVWLGAAGAYVAVRKDGSTVWDLKTKYSDLESCLELVSHSPGKDGSGIKALAMNPSDSKQWIILFKDGRTSFNEGKKYTFDARVYAKWCSINLETVHLIPPTQEIEGISDHFDQHRPLTRANFASTASNSNVDLSSISELVELEANTPALPPQSADEIVELEADTEIPSGAQTPAIVDSRPALKHRQSEVSTKAESCRSVSSGLKARLSKLRFPRRKDLPGSRPQTPQVKG